MTENGIITGLDFAKALGCKTMAERYKKITEQIVRQGVPIDTPFINTRPVGNVNAEIEIGRWVAKCPTCNGSELVDPADPIFYCCSCGNRSTGGKPMNVVFPRNVNLIEKEVMKRPVDDSVGRNKMERAFNAKALISVTINGVAKPLSRSWTHDETLRDLKRQNIALESPNIALEVK